MNMVLDASPVVFLNPFSGRVDTMPVEMIGAYFPNGTALHLEEAARVACIHDTEASENLLESFNPPILSTVPEERKTGLDSIESWYPSISESVDEPSAQPEAVR